jgi:hypothetical protein
MGLFAVVSLMIACYEHGRTKTVPPYWRDAHATMLARRDPMYRAYKAQRALVDELRKRYEPLEQLDMTELTGGPMHTFLAASASSKKQKIKK